MTEAQDNAAAPLPTLRQVLARAHLSIAFIAVNMGVFSLLLGSLLALRLYSDTNLHLLARSISYTVEAAVVFHDHAAAEEMLALFSTPEGVARVEIVNPAGDVIASWRRPGNWVMRRVQWQIAGIISVLPRTEPITHEGVVVGEVRVWGDGRILLRFLLIEILGGVVSLVVSMLIAIRLSRGMDGRIVTSIEFLIGVVHQLRQRRDFTRRVPRAPIAELNDLAGDFNALLTELESWQAILRNENTRLMHDATHDTLTALPNRGLFGARLSRAVAEAEVSGATFAVLFLDCDHFKTVNDTFGHAAGDALLLGIAARLRENRRAYDLVSRFGGDEFAVMLTPLRVADDIGPIADSIIAAQRAPILLPGGDAVVTSLSIGIALFPMHGPTAQTLLRAADDAMYRVKRQRRGGWQLATGTNDAEAFTQMEGYHA